MPLSHYDRFFGGERGSADKALDSMRKTYGRKEGEHVFYAKIAKAKRKTKSTRRRKR